MNELEYPLFKDALCQVLLNWPTGSCEDENVKSLQTDRWMTNDRQSEKLTWAFSSAELKMPEIRHSFVYACTHIEPIKNTCHLVNWVNLCLINSWNKISKESFYKSLQLSNTTFPLHIYVQIKLYKIHQKKKIKNLPAIKSTGIQATCRPWTLRMFIFTKYLTQKKWSSLFCAWQYWHGQCIRLLRINSIQIDLNSYVWSSLTWERIGTNTHFSCKWHYKK